jgi:hypothetical protein
MRRGRTRGVSVVFATTVIALMMLFGAASASAGFKPGLYEGQTQQSKDDTNLILFKATKKKVKTLTAQYKAKCTDEWGPYTRYFYDGRETGGKIKKNGSFRIVTSFGAIIKGQLKKKKATGTLSIVYRDLGENCADKTGWKASWKRK